MKHKIEAKISFEIEVEEGYELNDELSVENIQYDISSGLKEICYICSPKLLKGDNDYSYPGNIKVEKIMVSSPREK